MAQTNKFTEIANAIRKVEDRTDTYKIKANDFATEIGKLDPKLNAHYKDFENTLATTLSPVFTKPFSSAHVCT